MNMNELAKRIALIEGKRKPISIAQVKEVLGILADVFAASDHVELGWSFVCLGRRRAKRPRK